MTANNGENRSSIAEEQPIDVPALRGDPAFWGMTATQFLGAFNDNLFKQLVLLVAVDAARSGRDLQPIAMGLFALPFVFFSGFAGFLSDRYSKRQIVILAKVAEIVVMLAGVAAFFIGGMNPPLLVMLLLAVLCLMGMQSAFFGPAKYGILPELFRSRDLPQANGIVQMTTFLAIIFGMALAGYSKEWFTGRMWMVSGICVVIAIAGTLTSLSVRRTPVAYPGLRFRKSTLAISGDTWAMLRNDPALLKVLLLSSLFWFVGGVVQQGVNAFGKLQLELGDARTSLLAACMGVGIAVGCVVAGNVSRHGSSFRLVAAGIWGLIASLLIVAFLGVSNLSVEAVEWWSRIVMASLGFFGGLFAVPLQVFMQIRPPTEQKGRMIGAMNLVNWIAILLSAAFFGVCSSLFGANGIMGLPISWTFAMLAGVLIPAAVWFLPKLEAQQLG